MIISTTNWILRRNLLKSKGKTLIQNKILIQKMRTKTCLVEKTKMVSLFQIFTCQMTSTTLAKMEWWTGGQRSN